VGFLGVYTSEKDEKFMVMEFVSRGSLDDILRTQKDKLKTSDLVDMIYGAACGMEYLETFKILHRDLGNSR